MMRFVATISLCVYSFAFGYLESRPMIGQPPNFKTESTIRINLSGIDNNITKHIQIIDSIINANKAKLISNNFQIDSSKILIDYNASFVYKINYKNNKDILIKFIKDNFSGTKISYNEASNNLNETDSTQVQFYVNLMSKEYNQLATSKMKEFRTGQENNVYLLICAISIALLIVISTSILLIKLAFRKKYH